MKRFHLKGGFWLNFFSCLLIPLYTLWFAGSMQWFSTNFSVIAVTGIDHYRGFLYWGILVGGYFAVMMVKISFFLPRPFLRADLGLLTLASCLSLAYALAIPYLPDYFPKYATLHVILAALASVLLMLALLLCILSLRPCDPARFRPLLLAWCAIVVVSGVLLLLAGIVSTALEVFFSISAALLIRSLWLVCRSAP